MNTIQIAKMIGVTSTCILEWMQRLNVPRRSYSEACSLSKSNHVKLSSKAQEWIEGELLSDASIIQTSLSSSRFSYGSKYFEYINYVSKTLSLFGIEQSGKIDLRKEKEGNIVFHYKSRLYIELLELRKRWYPKGKKRIPEDIELTPITLKHFYIGDGTLVHPKGKMRPYIHLYVYSYLPKEVKFLSNKLQKLGLKNTINSHYNVIRISSYSIKDFLNYIGSSPTKCYEYKWNYTKGGYK